MKGKKLAIGIQSFSNFYEGGLIYVDKTEKIHEMMQIWGYHFIVRPRRFGKSLFLNTLALFTKVEKSVLKKLGFMIKWIGKR